MTKTKTKAKAAPKSAAKATAKRPCPFAAAARKALSGEVKVERTPLPTLRTHKPKPVQKVKAKPLTLAAILGLPDLPPGFDPQWN